MYYIVKNEWVKDFFEEELLLAALLEEVQSYIDVYYPTYHLEVCGEWQGNFLQEFYFQCESVDEWVCDLIKTVLYENFY